MIVKIIKQPKYPQSWYYDRVGQCLEVLQESKLYDGTPIYIVQKGIVINSYIDKSDCEIVEE